MLNCTNVERKSFSKMQDIKVTLKSDFFASPNFFTSFPNQKVF